MVSNKILEIMNETEKIMYDYPDLDYYETFNIAKYIIGRSDVCV
jgi:hypothetical protein